MSENVFPVACLYEAIKAEVRSGAFPSGQRISAAALAKRFSTSVIPVRETLYRLAGEHLVEARHHEGFFAPRIGEAVLRDMYQYQFYLLLSALDHLPERGQEERGPFLIDTAAPTSIKIETLFSHVGARAGNGELDRALHNILDRLYVVSAKKQEVTEDWPSECNGLLDQWRYGDRVSFRRALLAYHHRRVELIPALVKRLDLPRTTQSEG